MTALPRRPAEVGPTVWYPRSLRRTRRAVGTLLRVCVRVLRAFAVVCKQKIELLPGGVMPHDATTQRAEKRTPSVTAWAFVVLGADMLFGKGIEKRLRRRGGATAGAARATGLCRGKLKEHFFVRQEHVNNG